jgi:hypothetical protein
MKLYSMHLHRELVLGVLLNVYQDQVIKAHEMLSLQRDRETDMYWIDILIKLCEVSL